MVIDANESEESTQEVLPPESFLTGMERHGFPQIGIVYFTVTGNITKKIRGPLFRSPSILFSAYLRQHCLDQVVEGIFSAFYISST